MYNDTDTTTEVPEVKYQAVGAHCKKLDIQGCVTGVQKERTEGR
jgi:hypothetical protein